MIATLKFESVAQLQNLQKLACAVSEDVFIHSEDDAIMVDAKSFIGLFTLDFAKPVKVVTESQYVIDRVSKI